MNDKDIYKIRVAAADLEAADFERDHAALNLEEAVGEALEHGESVNVVADAAGMSPTEVIGVNGVDPARADDFLESS